ncbi:MAG: GNAT family N-acetyltransferase [Actinomycetota bacterium]|nr:GNAT family N-acetyltransferase [Actinomycetota bacterium]
MIAAQVHAYLRTPGPGRRQVRVGPFTVRFTPGNRHPMSNYAVPDDGARPTATDVESLVEAFAARGLVPRVEYVADAAPHLEAALLTAGFTIDDRLPLMACPPGAARRLLPPEGIAVVQARSREDHADAIRVADLAYGEPTTTPPDPVAVLARLRAAGRGAVVVVARDVATGAACGSGVATVPRAGVSELAGIGTHPDFRGRGVAASVTSLLARLALAGPVELLWLTPGDDGAARVYERVGFGAGGATMVHASRPRPKVP